MRKIVFFRYNHDSQPQTKELSEAFNKYTSVLMQGSGCFGVEAVLTGTVGPEDKLLIVSNGAYGERMEDIAKHAGLAYTVYHQDYAKSLSAVL